MLRNSAPNSVTQVNMQQVPNQAAFIRPNTVEEDVVEPETLNVCCSRCLRLVTQVSWATQAGHVSKVTESCRSLKTLKSHQTMEGESGGRSERRITAQASQFPERASNEPRGL